MARSPTPAYWGVFTLERLARFDLCAVFQSYSLPVLSLAVQELRIIVASATLDAEQFREFFETNRWVERVYDSTYEYRR